MKNELTNIEWVALTRYLQGTLYLGGSNLNRKQLIEAFKTAKEKVIHVGLELM